MPATDLPRKLSFVDLLSICVGNMIGAAVFVTPNIIAQALPSTEWILAAWIFAGMLSLFGALSCAELGAMMPHSGGQYVYLKESLGPFWGFLFGWTAFVAIRSAGIASLSVAFSLYLGHFLPLSSIAAKTVSVSLILILASVNYVGVRSGAAVQNLFTLLKLAGLGAIIFSGLFADAPSKMTFGSSAPFSFTQFGLALVPCLWAYQGWFSVPMVAGEAKNPGRNIPLSLGIGVAAVIAVYLSANLAYFKVLSLSEIAGASRVASEAMMRTMGNTGASLVAAAIMASIVSAINAGVLAGPRIYYAQAKDGLFFSAFARVHPKYETPGFSIWTQAIWSCLLALSGSYQQLITYAAFTSWLFYALTVIGLFVLRRREPNAERPYKVWGYPVTPIVFAAVSSAFVLNTMYTSPVPSFWGVVLIASGIPLYLWLRKPGGSEPTLDPLRQGA